MTEESAITDSFDESNFSIGHKNLIDGPTYVARMKQEIDRAKDYSSSAAKSKKSILEQLVGHIHIHSDGSTGNYRE